MSHGSLTSRVFHIHAQSEESSIGEYGWCFAIPSETTVADFAASRQLFDCGRDDWKITLVDKARDTRTDKERHDGLNQQQTPQPRMGKRRHSLRRHGLPGCSRRRIHGFSKSDGHRRVQLENRWLSCLPWHFKNADGFLKAFRLGRLLFDATCCECGIIPQQRFMRGLTDDDASMS